MYEAEICQGEETDFSCKIYDVLITTECSTCVDDVPHILEIEKGMGKTNKQCRHFDEKSTQKSFIVL